MVGRTPASSTWAQVLTSGQKIWAVINIGLKNMGGDQYNPITGINMGSLGIWGPGAVAQLAQAHGLALELGLYV